VIDPIIDVVRIYRRTDNGFGRPIELSRETGDTLSTPLLPGFAASLGEIFTGGA
jgi:hypothetical protein